ncbi:hypothetical protein [Brevibacillus brevis]|uniref:hypothetical protein n=1 Tax=Brevibacillus brevis TaxID=1393 RepID=UPI002571306F|nr:hypothetical protein [Lysinibacillus sp. SDF0063]
MQTFEARNGKSGRYAYPAAFALKHMAKDLRLANEAGVSPPLAESVNATYHHALESGLGELDLMAILRHLGGK